MGDLGYGYGSEWHLLRYLGRHRNLLDARVMDAVGATRISWLDFGFDTTRESFPDMEIRALDFLPDYEEVKTAWAAFWPQSGNPTNWDAVATATVDGGEEWILIEAKAHVGELASDCGAEKLSSVRLIRDALAQTKSFLGVLPERDWVHGYYQYCRHLTMLYFLVSHGIPAHLVNIYFTGDHRPDHFVCPRNTDEWAAVLRDQEEHVGLPASHPMSHRVHRLFLPVSGPQSRAQE